MPEQLMTAEQVAGVLGMTTKAVHNMVDRGQIQYVLINSRRRFKESTINQMIYQNTKERIR